MIIFSKLKKRWIDIVLLYDNLIYTEDIKNSSALALKIKQEDKKIGIDFVGSYCDNVVNFYYLIRGYPEVINIGFRENLRMQCMGDVKISYLNLMKNHNILWESPQMKSKLNTLREVNMDTKNEFVDAFNKHSKIDKLKTQGRIERSLDYLTDATKDRGCSALESSVLVIISGTRGDIYDESVKAVELYASQIGLYLDRVLYDIPELINIYSPFSRGYTKNLLDFLPRHVMTDELLARFSSYTQGTIGNKGMVWGVDINSSFPMLKEVKRTAETAENWLITAETGGGKSYAVKFLVLQLLAAEYNGTIMDIEGFEYTPMANFISHGSKVQVINMGEGSGKYFDPVEIHDRIGIPEVDKDAKTLSYNFTLAILKILLGRAFNENLWLDVVINDAVSKMYNDIGVTDDMNTWDKSKGKSLFDIYEVLKGLEGTKDNLDYNNAVVLAIALLSRYFEIGGTRANVFKDRIFVGDIIDADLLICSFGMAGKSPQTVDTTQLALMQLFAAQISHQRSIFSKAKGKFNFKLWEEFQRWGKFPDSEKTLGVALTGGRKLGDVNIVVTNQLGELLKDDKFGIFGSVTSFMCGAIADERVRTEFCNVLSIPNMKYSLDLISKAKKDLDDAAESNLNILDNGGESTYAYGFLYGFDRLKYGVGKVLLPEDLRKSELFRTGI